jgi:hypothetical protein
LAAESFIIVGSQTPHQPSLYLSKGERSDILKSARMENFYMWVFSLKPSAGQGPNPWNGLHLKLEGGNAPLYEVHALTQQLCYALQDMSPEQAQTVVTEATEQMKLWLEKRQNRLVEMASDPNTEIIDVLPQVSSDPIPSPGNSSETEGQGGNVG